MYWKRTSPIPGNGKSTPIQCRQSKSSNHRERYIVRLNVYTTSTQEFFTSCIQTYQSWITKHGIKQATTMIEVKGLFGGLTVELEATVVK